MPDTETRKCCRYCDGQPAMRFVKVRIGKRTNAEDHVLPIDVEPHALGRVIERSDAPGEFKLLAPSAVVPEGVATFRLHGASNCGSKR